MHLHVLEGTGRVFEFAFQFQFLDLSDIFVCFREYKIGLLLRISISISCINTKLFTFNLKTHL